MRKPTKLFLTIKREIFVLSVCAFLLVSFVISSVFFLLLYDENVNAARNSLRESNSQIVIYTQGLFRENEAMLKLLAYDAPIIHAGYGNPEMLLARFDVVLGNNPNLTYVYSGYEDGCLYIRDYTVPEGYDVTGRPWYQAAMKTDGVARLVYTDAATGVWLFSQCMKLTDENGTVTGALAMDCSNESITQQLSTKYRYESQRSYIIDENGTVLIHPRESQVNRSLREYLDEESWSKVMAGRNYAEYLVDGVKAMAYFEHIPNTMLTVVTAIDADEATGPIARNLATLVLVMLALSLGLGLAMSRIYILRFGQPLRKLSGRIRSLAAGRTDLPLELGTSNAEMQSIAYNIELIVKDMAEREEKRKAAEYLSFHDSMTGLYNRRFFEEELGRLNTPRNYPLCILCCDVNGLKLVNDVFGHALGDDLLRTVAETLQRAMRADDILARMGGDEFSVILPQTEEPDTVKIIERIQHSLPRESLCGAEVSVSVGYAFKTNAQQPLDGVLRAADEMMYERKTLESAQMKEKTVENIITAAEREGLVGPLTEKELAVLRFFSARQCPESEALLLDSYRLRRLGLCSLLFTLGYKEAALSRRHTETGYRVLSSLDRYRSVGACVLHYKEHWDGTGWPSGLAGLDIPLLSRIIAVTADYIEHGSAHVKENSGTFYDEQLVMLLSQFPEH